MQEPVDVAGYDFLDLGCSGGGSLAYGKARFGAGRGLGVDLDPAKVAETRAGGHDAILADATRLDLHNAVSFTLMMDFLEHLPDLATVERVIASAAAATTDFLFISHPSFEGEEYLAELGLRQYWWHWSGHPTHIHMSDYCEIFDRLGLRQYMVRFVEPVADSGHPSILTASEPINEPRYDPDIHQPRPSVTFSRPIWRSQEIFVALRPFAAEEWGKITEPRS